MDLKRISYLFMSLINKEIALALVMLELHYLSVALYINAMHLDY